MSISYNSIMPDIAVSASRDRPPSIADRDRRLHQAIGECFYPISLQLLRGPPAGKRALQITPCKINARRTTLKRSVSSGQARPQGKGNSWQWRRMIPTTLTDRSVPRTSPRPRRDSEWSKCFRRLLRSARRMNEREVCSINKYLE
jgi:hypothetical protein